MEEIRCAKDDASDVDAGGDDCGQYNLVQESQLEMMLAQDE